MHVAMRPLLSLGSGHAFSMPVLNIGGLTYLLP